MYEELCNTDMCSISSDENSVVPDSLSHIKSLILHAVLIFLEFHMMPVILCTFLGSLIIHVS